MGAFDDDDFTPEEAAAWEQMQKAGVAPPSQPAEGDEQPAPEKQDPAADQQPAEGEQQVDEKNPADDNDEEDAGDDDTNAELQVSDDGRLRDKKGKFVPHKALHAEREEHKKTRSALRERELENARISERLATLLEAIGGPKPGAQAAQTAQPAAKPTLPADLKPINAEEDLVAAISQAQSVLPVVQHVQQSLEELREMQRRQAEEASVAEMARSYASSIEKAKQSTPHFDDAVRHLVTQQDAMLAAQGVSDPAVRRSQIEQAERAFVAKCFQDRVDPAQRLVALAQAVGWKAPEQQATPGNQQGATASPAAQKIDRIANMQKASQSLSGVGSTGRTGMPTPAQIAAMDEEEFDAFVAKVGGQKEFERRYLGR